MNFYMECNSLSITGMEDSFAVCFGFMDKDELSQYVMLQATLVDGAPCQDSELYLELNDQSCSSYGGILKCELTPGALKFDLSDAAANELGLERWTGTISHQIELRRRAVRRAYYGAKRSYFPKSKHS